MSLNEAIKKNNALSKNYNKLQDHISILKEREAKKVTQMEELANQKEKLAESWKVKEAKVVALRYELEKAKSNLAQDWEELVDA